MKKMLTLSALAVVAATSGQAQTIEDWQGFYTSLVIGSTSTDLTMTGSTASASQTGLGLAVGNNHHMSGNWFVGGELHFAAQETDFGNTFTLDSERSVRARIGYATGRSFFYGTLGYAMADVNSQLNPADSGEVSGLLAGVGVEYLVTDRMSLRFEYVHRNLTGDPITPQVNARQPLARVNLQPQPQVVPVDTDTSGGQFSLGLTIHF
jgi:opacity protein-like surface antigen